MGRVLLALERVAVDLAALADLAGDAPRARSRKLLAASAAESRSGMRSGRLDSEDLDRVSLAIVTASTPLLGGLNPSSVMAGLVPAIHEF